MNDGSRLSVGSVVPTFSKASRRAASTRSAKGRVRLGLFVWHIQSNFVHEAQETSTELSVVDERDGMIIECFALGDEVRHNLS